jgi:hypothetical protein
MSDRGLGQVLELMSERESAEVLERMSEQRAERAPAELLALRVRPGFRHLYRCRLQGQRPLRLDRTRPRQARLQTKS